MNNNALILSSLVVIVKILQNYKYNYQPGLDVKKCEVRRYKIYEQEIYHQNNHNPLILFSFSYSTSSLSFPLSSPPPPPFSGPRKKMCNHEQKIRGARSLFFERNILKRCCWSVNKDKVREQGGECMKMVEERGS